MQMPQMKHQRFDNTWHPYIL